MARPGAASHCRLTYVRRENVVHKHLAGVPLRSEASLFCRVTRIDCIEYHRKKETRLATREAASRALHDGGTNGGTAQIKYFTLSFMGCEYQQEEKNQCYSCTLRAVV